MTIFIAIFITARENSTSDRVGCPFALSLLVTINVGPNTAIATLFLTYEPFTSPPNPFPPNIRRTLVSHFSTNRRPPPQMSRNEIEFKVLVFCAASLITCTSGLALSRWGILDKYSPELNREPGVKPGRLRLHVPRGFSRDRSSGNPSAVSFRGGGK